MPADQASGPRAPVKVAYVDVEERLANLPALAATAAYPWALVFFQRGARVVGHAYVDLRADDPDDPDELRRRLAEMAPAGPAEPDATPLGPLPRVSVVIPSTLDRLEPLRRTLRSLVAQRHQDFEAIVVDNRPDGTPGRAATHEELRVDPRIRVVEEAMPGISAARNRGIASATADIIAFTDDDVEAAPGWLGAIADRFAREPDTDGVTGLVLPAELETAPQVWFECSGGKIDQRYQPMTYRVDRDVSRFAAVGRDHTGAPAGATPLYRAKFGMGANMAFRARALTALGGFELALGAGTASRGGEDIVMISRLLYDGRALTFDPAVVVRHYHRREIGELRSQMRGYGVGYTAALLALIRDDPRHVWGILAMLRGAGRVASERSNQRVAADFPASLSRTEMIGLATGPFAYARSVWGNRASVARKAGAALLPATAIAMKPKSRLEQPEMTLADYPTAGERASEHASAPRIEPMAEPESAATVAICAYTMKRWTAFTGAVRSIVPQLRPGDECLVVIDHNDELFGKAAVEFGTALEVRVIESSGPKGLSGARNTAVAASRGGIVAFLDDDAAANPGWLDRVRAELAADDVLGVGTAALPAWPAGRRPAWFPPEFDWVVGCSYLGLPTQDTDVRNVIGAAMAFRREVFDLAGDFSTEVGRVGAAPTGCEETELCIRLRQKKPGSRVRYLPGVAASHMVTADRLKIRYFLRRCLGEGRSKARVSRLVGAGDGLSTERAYVTSVLPRAVLREVKRGLAGKWSGWTAACLIIMGVFLAGVGYLGGRLPRRDN